MKHKPFGHKANYDGKKKETRDLTPASAITERLKQGYDPIYRSSCYQQMRYAFGESWRKDAFTNISGAGLSDSDFPDFPDIRIRLQEIGRSRRILNSQFIGLSRTMYSDPQPEFPQVDKFTAEVRKQFFLSRYRGDGTGEGEWHDEMAAAFMEGDGLGLGFVQVCLRTNPKTGEQQTHLRHSPTIQTIWDRHERHPGHFRWVCFVRYMAFEDAALLFGEDLAKTGMRTVQDGYNTVGVKMVRYFEYYDLGYGRGKPTRAIILGNLTHPPAHREENEFGFLPYAYYCHFFAPGMRMPVGRIAIQMNSQEAINELEKAFRHAMRNGPITLANVGEVDESDLKRIVAGEQAAFVKWNPRPGGPSDPIQRVEATEVAQTMLRLFNIYQDQFTADSGVTDFDRGVQPSASRTLGEDMLIDQRGQTQSSWSELQAMKFHVRTVKKVLQTAAMFDRDPVTIDIFGRNYTVNHADRPASVISNWLEEPSEVVINTDSLRYQDVQQTRIQRLQQLLQATPILMQLGVDRTFLLEEFLKALGEQDPKAAMRETAAQPGQAVGLPTAGPQGMPTVGPPLSSAPVVQPG